MATNSGTTTRPTIGIAIIAKNAALHLDKVLASVAWADKVVIVDNGSTDATLDIAAKYGADILKTPDWPGFGVQKNRAIDRCGTDWVMVLDADEVVSDELAASIRKVAGQAGGPNVWELNRLSSLCGRWVRHGGWHPDWIPRLFRSGKARMSDDLVHESLVFQGKPGRLTGLLMHYSFDDYESVLRKIDSYSGAAAKQRFAAGKRGSFASAVFRGWWAFVKTYFFKLGFLDGWTGFTLAVMNAEHSYYRYLKLRLMGEQKSGESKPGR